MEWITAILTVVDWTITQAEGRGETVPPDILAARTILRNELVRQAAEEAD